MGWPDIFNSGVLVVTPGEDKFEEVRAVLNSRGSWDGGDQGVLNEWRGGDWNRLSFTYNTTPTAAYTYVYPFLSCFMFVIDSEFILVCFRYAPAYERFGSQISAIHFIGSNKPWNSIPYRAPGTSSTTEQSQNEVDTATTPPPPPQAYDYDSLVDRWYNVYDTHYRSQALVPEPQIDFEVQKYVSAWDEQTDTRAGMIDASVSASSSATPADRRDGEGEARVFGAPLGLEDLRRLAVEGMGGGGGGVEGEGQYMSLPLDGRVDLMRPLQVEEQGRKQDQDQVEDQVEVGPAGPVPSTPVSRQRELGGSEVGGGAGGIDGSPPRLGTMPTPGPDELPPTPYLRGQSLPPTPVPPPGWHKQKHDQPSPSAFPSPVGHLQPHDIPQPQLSHQPQPPHQPQPQERPEHQRIPSPPLLSWNPSIDPPPNITPLPSAFPSDTYFPNAWDRSSRSVQLASDDPYQPSMTDQRSQDSVGFFEVPPPTEIPSELLRQGHYRNVTGPHSDESPSTPSPDRAKVKRVFPWEEKPRHLPGRVFPGSQSPPPGMIFMESPKVEVLPPPSAAEAEVPTTPEKHSQIYTTPSPLNFGFQPNLTYANAWDTVPQITKYANRLVRPAPWPQSPLALAVPFEEGGGQRRKSWDDQVGISSDADDEGDADEDGTEITTSKSRSRSGSSLIPASRSVRGKYRTQGVQTIRRVKRSIGVQAPDSSEDEKTSARAKKVLIGSGTHPPVVLQAVQTPPQPFMPTSSLPAAHPASGLRSPRESISPQGSSPSRSPIRVVPALTTSLPSQPLAQRTLSSDTNTSVPSPASSVGSVSSPDGQPIGSPPRKAGRVWDPARGVELFKRGSEEVLARFLKMGSWEEDGDAPQHHA